MSKHHVPRLDLPGIPDERFRYVRRDKREHEALRNDFNHQVRADFRRHLAANCRDELVAAGFDERQIADLAAGRNLPGYNVHHKHPLGDSGINDFSNLVLMDMPSHTELHMRVDPQIAHLARGHEATIRMPVPPGSVYVHPSLIRQHKVTRRQADQSEDHEITLRPEYPR